MQQTRRLRRGKKLKRETDDLKGDKEELKRQIAQFRQQSIDAASKYEADTAARFESFGRELREVLQDGTVRSMFGRTYTPARVRRHCASQDSQTSKPFSLSVM